MPRNWQLPLTVENEEFFKSHFEGLSSFTPDNPAISEADLEKFFIAIDYPYNPLQLKIYKEFFVQYFNGMIPEDLALKGFRQLHDTAKTAAALASFLDKDGAGFISKEEFDHVMLVMYVHEPKVAFIDYKSFLKEAEEATEGRVSVEQIEVWVRRHLEIPSD